MACKWLRLFETDTSLPCNSQAVLVYETFKALKAAPPPRKRRNANKSPEDGVEAAPKQTAYAANKRKRAMKVMLRAWLVYVRDLSIKTRQKGS